MKVQVIANGYTTFAQDYRVDDPSQDIKVEMLRAREQVSSYKDNKATASTRKWGVREPVRPEAGGGESDSHHVDSACSKEGRF